MTQRLTLPLSADDAHVWLWHTPPLSDTQTRDLRRMLSKAELARADRFLHAKDRRDFTAAHALLRQTLSRYGDRAPCDWRFDTDREGKPHIAPGQAANLWFNLSHTSGLVACVVARAADVGVDVESLERVVAVEEIAARVFSVDERRYLAATTEGERGARFIEIWTLKEAYLKAIGRGLSDRLVAFSIIPDGDRGLRFEPPASVCAKDWQLALGAPGPSYRIAVAVNRPGRNRGHLTLRRFDAPDGRPMPWLRMTSAQARPAAERPSRHWQDGRTVESM